MEKSPRIQTAEISTDVEHEVKNIINGTCIVLQMQFGVNVKGHEDDCQMDADNKQYGDSVIHCSSGKYISNMKPLFPY